MSEIQFCEEEIFFLVEAVQLRMKKFEKSKQYEAAQECESLITKLRNMSVPEWLRERIARRQSFIPLPGR